MFFIPVTAVINQPPTSIVSTTIDFELEKMMPDRDIKTYYIQFIGTTATTDKEIGQFNYMDSFSEDYFDLVIKTRPKTLIIKKVKIVSVSKFIPKISL